MAIEATLVWCDEAVHHRDRLIVADSALLADGRWTRAAEQARARGEAELDPSPWITPAGLAPVALASGHFRLGGEAVPGRFYPRLAFPDLAQGARDARPTRLLDVRGDHIQVDPNHPLAGHDARLILRPSELPPASGRRMAELFDGPGLQSPSADPAATYFSLDGFAREDDATDSRFYAEPRFVQHLDAACRAAISALHGRLLPAGGRVLDLMASWDSHLPDTAADCHIAGLGLNLEELAANPRLRERVVKDLNERDELPWGDAQFDVVLCTASIEYLIRPRMVLAEVRRVLRPGGVCVLTFSDRWFPPKVIRLWRQLHPFERLGFALALLRDAGFVDLRGETLRGVARPEDDKYIDQRNHADPLFAAWGKAP